ncbi:cilia- and flagella-associated protein 57 isoform X3 [Rattus norvegicus]|uniref:cilia and flagella associated protein 57 isoform 3 n=1 Tax=Rattus norvegicus TaxID=10116 RepID=UPI0003D07418|nr:cilia- and flagella-associated protein 57 isoform X3 [Rattus norvegicus]|eukprot:XP_017449297.1 PREDICTED: cilia- and flagella-associated protein 57 isoform X2 [Rattus norvegicus]
MSTVVAQSLHVFGLRSHVTNNIFFFDEQIVIFPSGNHCVKYNLDQKWQKFIAGSDKSQGMLALSISPNRRYLAISETVQDKPIITIYELSSIPCRKRKVLNNFEFQVQKFTSMAFSPDSKYLLTQTSPPESNLVYWLWEKQKVMAVIKADIQNNPIYQVSINPQDNTQVCITGNGIFKILRFAEGTLKQTNFQRGESPNCLAHSWVSEDRIIVGTDTGKLFLFESGDQRWETNIMVKEPTSSRSLDIIHESESLVEFPPPSSPASSIEQMSTTTYTQQVVLPQVFAIAAYSKGFACSAGPGRVLLFEKVEEKDFYRESREIRIPVDPQSNDPSQSDKQDVLCLCFSPSEETLVASTSKNQLYSITMSLTEISKIRSLVWNTDDSKLISAGTDGAVYEWNLSTGKRETECVLKVCSYNSVTISPDGKVIFAVGSDQTLKEIADSLILREIPAFDVVYTAITISHSGRMIFVGTSVGTIRAMKYPLPLQREFNEYQAHAGPVTKILLTFDDQFLLTVSEDGCLFTWKVFDKEGRGIKREREVGFAEEVLVTKTDMEEKAQIMLELKTRVEELKMENEYQLRLKDMNYSEKIKELTDKFIQEMESLKTKNQVLKTEKEKQDISHREHLEDLIERQSRELQDLECCNNQKLLLEYEKYQELQLKSQRMQEEYEKQLRDNDETKSQALEELTEFYEAKLQEKTGLLEEAQEDVRQQLREFEETKKQIEEDEDREIQDIKTKYERKLRDEKESNLRLKGETGIMRKKFSSLQKEIEERTNDIELLKTEQVKLQGVIRSLEKDIQGLKREIQERDETIQDKEKRIYDLKKKNQELEKFKFVLDYKIKELKKQIEPRENEIKVMKEQIQEMEDELERFHKQNTQLELNITELLQKLRATDQEMRKEQQKERDLEALVRRFKTDLHNCVSYIQEPRQLKEKIRALFEKYVQRADMVEIAGLNSDLQQEYARQREHLERNLATLKKKVVKEGELHRADYVRIMQENVSLIKEINELRRELKLTRSQIYDLESALKVSKKTRAQEAPESVLTKDVVGTSSTMRLNEQEETGRIIEMQRLEIRRLRDQIQEQEQVPGFHTIAGVRLPSLVDSDVDFEVHTK